MDKRKLSLVCVCFVGVLITMTGCRGQRSEKSPVHLNPNMDIQSKFKEQTLSLSPPDGVLPWGDQSGFYNDRDRASYVKMDSAFYEGRKEDGTWIETIPVPVTRELMKRGKERYDIFCAACHTRTGDGTKSPISSRGWVIPNITLSLTKNRTDGELFDIVGNGIRTMPGYRKTIKEQDRWAIVAYLRALQTASGTSVKRLPKETRLKLRTMRNAQ